LRCISSAPEISGSPIFVRPSRTLFEQEIVMNKPMLIAAAISLALSGTAFAGGGKDAKRSAQGQTASAITMKDCQMLTVASARKACEQSAERGNGGIDSAAVGMSSDVTGSGLTAGSGLSETPSRSNDTSDPATYSTTPR
jgi:hypothetical protein